MPDEPTPRELDRRLTDMRDEMRSGFRDLNTRLDKVPTNEVLLAHMATWDAQLRAITARVDNMPNNDQLEAVRGDVEELKTEMSEAKAQARTARQWGISGVLIPAAGIVVAAVGVIRVFG